MRLGSPTMPRHATCLTLALLALGCTLAQVVSVASRPLEEAEPCLGRFVAHPLEHVTRAHGEAVRFYDSNGAGVAVGDLSGNGYLDLVLANLNGNNAIFWNEGGLRFRKEALSHGHSRAVAVVDVDGDGRLDIVFTQSLGSLGYWRNTGEGLVREALPGVTFPAYSMAWGDLSGNGRLDVVTASYDALLEQDLGNTFLFGRGAGVVVYENAESGFRATRLAERAQALALLLVDLNDDGRLDIVVGNDFEVPDYAWLNTASGWQDTMPFSTTYTRNTMSLDAGDSNNDGQLELFATDMKPDFRDLRALAAWMPLVERSYHTQRHGDPQKPENAFQVRRKDGFDNRAYRLGLDATGWSWAGKFGDLDNDGLLDLYVVNGMIARDLFAYLPGDELVEANVAFRNTGHGFKRVPAWGLGSSASGRGMVMADLTNNGKLDIVVNNLESPAVVFENRLCDGDALTVELYAPGGGNTRALGATLWLHTAIGTLRRDVGSTRGYLSAEAPRVHFGFPAGTELDRLEVRWPDGTRTLVPAPDANAHLTLTREQR